MSELPGPRSSVVDQLLRDVVATMTELFGISEVEAAGRIARDFGSWDLTSEDTQRVLGHEDAVYWANFVYYGPNVDWWRLSADELRPRSWP